MDELGVLLYGHSKNAYWYGSQLTIEDTRRRVPDQNATALQVTSAVIAGMAWALKNPEKGYEAGARSFTWVKLKRIDEEGYSQGAADSVDCVVMGYYTGKGVRTQFGMGAFLAGIYDEETLSFKTVTKVGTGMKESDLENIKKLCDQHKSAEAPKDYLVDKDLYPDVWVKPHIVVELRADEITISPKHTATYALRFPRLIRIRTDKKADQATSLKELEDLFLLQKK